MPLSDERFHFPTPPEDFLAYPDHKVVALMDDPKSVQEFFRPTISMSGVSRFHVSGEA